MKFSYKFRLLAAFVAMLIFAGADAQAQVGGYFELSVVPSANSLLVSNSLTYTITVTNLVGDLTRVYTLVSNTLPATARYVSAVPNLGGAVTNYNNVIVFNIGGFALGGIVRLSLTVQPTAAGYITNLVVVSVASTIVTNTASTNVVTLVTNIPPVLADLGVAISVPTTAIITNDWLTYRVSVTNAGPASASGVVLTNTLPPGIILLGVSPVPPATVASNIMIFNLGTMNGGASTNLQLAIQPTNIGVLNFSAAVGAPGILDTNLADNTASNRLAVINYLAGQLTASVTSPQTNNPQNGLVEQTIAVSNAGPASVTAARVVVIGLTNQQLYNVAGTNGGNPFVVYISKLDTNQTVTLLLQFFATNYFMLADAQLQAFAVPVPALSPPPVASVNPNLAISRIVPLVNGDMLIEFPSTPGKTYTVVYSDNPSFSNALIAPPSIVAGANRKQWVDYGPPTTLSVPSAAPARFYRVIQNP